MECEGGGCESGGCESGECESGCERRDVRIGDSGECACEVCEGGG